WTPRTFDPDELGSIDMWLGPTKRVSSQRQLPPASDAALPASYPAEAQQTHQTQQTHQPQQPQQHQQPPESHPSPEPVGGPTR
ncbi:MAG TPA: hypothetical protein VGI00_05570, partial [Streptosporangiaceae bacterium]